MIILVLVRRPCRKTEGKSDARPAVGRYAVEPMTTESATHTYSGKARILDRTGSLIDVGKAEVTTDDKGSWSGSISVFKHSSVADKHITGLVELAGGRRGLATVGPKVADLDNDLIAVAVHGVDDVVPF